MESFETIELDVDNAVATITLNRPDAANVLSAQMTCELRKAALFCDTEQDVRAVMLTATGRFFCSGGDIRSMAERKDSARRFVKEAADEFHNAISTLARMPKPLVIAVNGAAAGAGFGIALVGDIVIGAASSTFKVAYSAAGLSPDGGLSYFLPRLVGLRRAQELILTNRTLDAAEAYRLGILTLTVPDEQLRNVATELAERLAAGPIVAHSSIKALLHASADNSLERQLEMESRLIALCAGSPDGLEGLTAFLQKRPAIFRS